MAKDYYLVHHGILGQKWGIRRFQNKDGSYTTEGKRRRREDSYSDDYKKIRDLKKKGTKNLSTKEIEEVNRRDNAVSQYNRNNGKKFVNKLGEKMLEKSAETVATIVVIKIGQRWLEKKLGI